MSLIDLQGNFSCFYLKQNNEHSIMRFSPSAIKTAPPVSRFQQSECAILSRKLEYFIGQYSITDFICGRRVLRWYPKQFSFICNDLLEYAKKTSLHRSWFL